MNIDDHGYGNQRSVPPSPPMRPGKNLPMYHVYCTL